MITFTHLIVFGVVELIIGFALGWFARGPRRRMERTDSLAFEAGMLVGRNPNDRGRLLSDITRLVEQHAERVEAFQLSIEQEDESAAGALLSNQIAELRDANRTFDEGVGQKVAQLADSPESALTDVAVSVSEHCDKAKSLDQLLGQIGSDALVQELKGMLSEALADVIDSKHQLESELSEVREKLEEKTARLSAAEQDARIDSLTRLPNRRAFDEQVAAAQSLFDRGQQAYALLMFDIDHFKLFNDEHGHAAGDTVLQTVARVLSERKRASDQSFRLGGEEFVMLLRSTSTTEAYKVAERMRKAIEEMVVIFEGQELKITASVGAASAEQDLTPQQVLERADASLYKAKQDGRNRTHLHQPDAETEAACEQDLAEPVGAAS